MQIFKMTKFVKCEWGLKCNLYTPKCTYEDLKLKKMWGWYPRFPMREVGMHHIPPPPPARPLAMHAATDRLYAKLSPHVPKRSNATAWHKTASTRCEIISNRVCRFWLGTIAKALYVITSKLVIWLDKRLLRLCKWSVYHELCYIVIV